ncbi:CopY/TcrY family copper transport repressor [Ignatzschineria cameli]|uniref:CopY/TcrY family copper transport repressor n=1 Tax=Ignatzschineria cameli TaxID=2182793 RepID=A0ABX5KYN4_9GAMM|nr:CopY/TcrY family copper transport repressor [Ignatzschineria cameli]PWD89007.1 CopY/TcrY family copper transport repressor [Ignatzschineria cameli]PWD90113.1 CopY/TcrY family copper transport repressor [Ignatzschineria cameli]PWD90776.1 CopY/TcrY family copper transport repressor [Ignatzschineria cameli]
MALERQGMLKEKMTIEITPSEWEVMRVLWANGVVGSREVTRILTKKRSWKPTTIKTLLARLVAKGAVTTEQVGNRYRYRPNIEEEEAWDSAAATLFSFVCARDRAEKIARLLMASPLERADITRLREALEVAEAQAIEQIDCDCFEGQCTCHLKVVQHCCVSIESEERGEQ